jgi:hypothetical protein
MEKRGRVRKTVSFEVIKGYFESKYGLSLQIVKSTTIHDNVVAFLPSFIKIKDIYYDDGDIIVMDTDAKDRSADVVSVFFTQYLLNGLVRREDIESGHFSYKGEYPTYEEINKMCEKTSEVIRFQKA